MLSKNESTATLNECAGSGYELGSPRRLHVTDLWERKCGNCAWKCISRRSSSTATRVCGRRCAPLLDQRICRPFDIRRIIEISAAGLGLHWPKLDADLYVRALVKGILGTKQWMTQFGAVGRRAATVAKAAAAQANGKLGGRPRQPRALETA